ncbi:hypothetical protein EMCRGX_G022530 [Ephydatia muelleri]
MLTVSAAPERNASKVCGRRNKALDFSSPFSHPKSGALGKKMSSEIPLEKLSRAEIELRRCLEEDTNAKLLKSYCCAWQRDILVQGHLYVTATCFCFYSNILGWETKVCLRCPEITAIVQCKTALVIPNAIAINIKDKKYVFTSFISRDKVYHNLFKVWQNALLNYPYAPEQLCSQLVTSTPKRNMDLSSDTTFDHSDVEGGVALTSNHGNREDSHMDQALDGSTGGSSGVEPDDAQDGQSTNEGHGQRLSAASDRTEASTASLGGGAFEASEDGSRRSSADTAKSVLPKKVDVGLQTSSSSMSNAVTIVVIAFILLFVVSMFVQLCRLSQVEPYLRFLLPWQPWCPCNQDHHHH